MKLFETLESFKYIVPDPAYTETSKRAILAAQPIEMPTWSFRRTIFRIMETTVAVALTGFFIFILAGGLSGSKFAPVQYSAIDPKALHAEAEAIDIQIKIANVAYENPAIAAESTAPTATSASKKPTAAKVPSIAATSESTSTASSTEPVTIDAALQSLSE